jgi:hypothetical protein
MASADIQWAAIVTREWRCTGSFVTGPPDAVVCVISFPLNIQNKTDKKANKSIALLISINISDVSIVV